MGRASIGTQASRVFVEYGFRATSVSVIAKACGISVGSIFNYFETKEHILEWIFQHYHEVMEAHLLKLENEIQQGSESTSGDTLEKVLRSYFAIIDEIAPLILLGYQESKSLSQPARRQLFDREEQLARLVARSFAPTDPPTDHMVLVAHWIIVMVHAWAFRGWAFRTMGREEYLASLIETAKAMAGREGV